MKKEKFSIDFIGLEVYMSKVIIISKKEFNEQIKFLDKQLEETKDDEYPMEKHIREYESDTLTKKVYRYDAGTSSTYLTHRICKDGYYFKK